MKLLQFIVVILGVVLLYCNAGTTPAETATYDPVTDAMLQDPPAGDWLMWRRTLNSPRISRRLCQE